SSLPAELLETAAQIFRAEAQDGYRDRVVIGGLAGFASKLGVERLSGLLADYGSLPPTEREARLRHAQSLLQNGSEGPAPAPPSSPPPRRATASTADVAL